MSAGPPPQPQSRSSQRDGLTLRLIALLKDEGLSPGSRLPSVTALAERFAVAPTTIREALRQLQALGFLEFRHGSGVYLRETVERVVVSNPYSGRLERAVLLDLIEARLLIEPHLAALVATRAEDEALSELDAILQHADDELRGDDARLSEFNLAFHRGIARHSGNAVLAQTIDSLLDLYEPEQRLILEVYDDRQRDADEHHAVLEAIRAHDRELAAQRMSEHLQGVRDVLERRLRRGRRTRGRQP